MSHPLENIKLEYAIFVDGWVYEKDGMKIVLRPTPNDKWTCTIELTEELETLEQASQAAIDLLEAIRAGNLVEKTPEKTCE